MHNGCIQCTGVTAVLFALSHKLVGLLGKKKTSPSQPELSIGWLKNLNDDKEVIEQLLLVRSALERENVCEQTQTGVHRQRQCTETRAPNGAHLLK